MKHLFALLFLLPILGLAQPTNVVLTTPNSTTPSTDNTLIGPYAGYTITSGRDNVMVGNLAGVNNTSGSFNVYVGPRAGFSGTTGQVNTFLGYYTGRNNTTASANVFIGGFTAENNTTGASNTFVGYVAGHENLSGKNNTFLGTEAGYSNTIGESNLFLGNRAGYNNVGAINNVFIGYNSGSNLTVGNNNVLLGANTQPTSGTVQNSVAIGYNAKVALNNAIILGDVNNTSIAVGIGTDSPQFPLDVRGIINLRNSGTIKYSHLSNPLRQGTTDQFLTVNEQGETVLAHYRLRIDNADQWSDKVFSPTYGLRSLTEVENYVRTYHHLPGIPSATEVVEQGMDAARMDAHLLEKVEELTLYSIQLEKTDRLHQQKLKQQEQVNQQMATEIEKLKQLVSRLAARR